jgi:SAM-dependent methyltransferase
MGKQHHPHGHLNGAAARPANGTGDAMPRGGLASVPDAAPGASPAGGTPGGDYNLLPYPTMPITLSQPLHMAATAALFGIDPPAVERARVLELGCASGGNIIPLAARFPQASFSGIDLSDRHIDQGRKAIADLGLVNVTLQQGDLTSLDLGGRQYDYIICHGVFSWVPKAAQDAIFRLCRQALVANGVATISYNVLPGWHLRMVIRDLCLRYAGSEGTPQRRVAKARAALARLAEASAETDPYGQLLRTEARRLKNVPAAYILGEFLAPDNAPCNVQDFIEQAAAAGLDFLCEADFAAVVPTTLDPAIRHRLASTGGPGRAAVEQEIDFLTGRLFRRSILVPRQPGGAHRNPADPARLDGLHVASPIRLDADQGGDDTAVFTDEQGRPVSTKDAAVREAFQRLATAYPATLTLQDLTAGVADGDPRPQAEVALRIRNAVHALVLAGRATLSTQPLRVGSAAHERPCAWPFARIEAASAQPWITTLLHAGVPAHPILKTLLPHLDGTQDRAALRARLVVALESGAVLVPELPAGQPPSSQEQLGIIAAQYVEKALQYLARNGLLETDNPADRAESPRLQ